MQGLALAALDLAALVGPVEETFQLTAVFPAQTKEPGGRHVGSFGAQEGFKAPSEIWAVPGVEAIALGGEPVVAEKLPHSICVVDYLTKNWAVGLTSCMGASFLRQDLRLKGRLYKTLFLTTRSTNCSAERPIFWRATDETHGAVSG